MSTDLLQREEKRTRWTVRTMMVGLVAVAGLVVVFSNGGLGNRKHEEGLKSLHAMAEKRSGRFDVASCRDHLSKITDDARTTDVREHMVAYPMSGDAVVGYVDVNGQNRVVPATQENVVPLFSRFEPRDLHKWAQSGKEVMFLFRDNTVIAAEAQTCRVTGVYLPKPSGAMNPLVAQQLINVKTESSCAVYYWYRQYKKHDQYCVDKCYHQSHSGQSCETLNKWITDKGWRKTKEYKCERNGCSKYGSCTREGPQCSSKIGGTKIAYLGNCELATNVCDFDNYFGTAQAEFNTMNLVKTVVAAASAFPGPIATPLKLLGASFGLGTLTSSNAQFNALMTKLNGAFTQMTQCLDKKLMKVDVSAIQTQIDKIKDHIKPSVIATRNEATKAAAADRISAIHSHTDAACASIKSTIAVAAMNSQKNFDMVLPHALDGTVLCATAYTMAKADYYMAQDSSWPIVSQKYKERLADTTERVAAGLMWFYAHYDSKARCGFFEPHKTLLCDKVKKLRADVLAPIAKIGTGMWGGCMRHDQRSFSGTSARLGGAVQTVAACDSLCKASSTCHCFSFKNKVCLSFKGISCFKFTLDTQSTAGTCKGQIVGGTVKTVDALGFDLAGAKGDVDAGSEQLTAGCRAACEKNEKCVGVAVGADGCVEIEDEASALAHKPVSVVFRGASVVEKFGYHVVDRSLAADEFETPHWGSCLAVCATRRKCVGVDVESTAGGVRCLLFNKHNRGEQVTEAVLDDKFDGRRHYDILHGAGVASALTPSSSDNCIVGAPCRSTNNIARGKPAYQISRGFNGYASRAVDGNTNNRYSGNSCTHTKLENNPWLYVEVSSAATSICGVKIFNRQDCCAERLNNFKVFVTDRKPYRGFVAKAEETCYHSTGTFNTKSISCTKHLRGKYVGVQIVGRQYLTICELQVFAM